MGGVISIIREISPGDLKIIPVAADMTSGRYRNEFRLFD